MILPQPYIRRYAVHMTPEPGSDDEQLVTMRIPRTLVDAFDAAVGKRNRSKSVKAYMAWMAGLPKSKRPERPKPADPS